MFLSHGLDVINARKNVDQEKIARASWGAEPFKSWEKELEPGKETEKADQGVR